MTIGEAITLQTSLKSSDILKYHPDLRNSTQLGIEALKRIGYLREKLGFLGAFALPGETED